MVRVTISLMWLSSGPAELFCNIPGLTPDPSNKEDV